MAYKVSDKYKEIIYSQDDKNQLKIIFNGKELENADYYCEKIARTARILPNDGSKRFSLDNFVSTELEVILHNVDESIIQDQIEISIGTLVDEENNTYEYVPFGIFNIQDTPTTDNNKITIKLRDNRVKFDFNYNAYPLMEENNETATKRQILEDICSQAGVENEIESFDNENEVVGTYDSTITATTYVSYLAEQSGMIATINRNGKLIFIDLNNLTIHKIPLSLFEKYEIGTPFQIQRVVYEDAIRKYQSSDDETLDTLYIDSANPYITSQAQIDNIYDKLKDFKIDSLTTGKVLGNPAIDPYDLIQIYGYYEEDDYGNYKFVADEDVIVATTLASTDYTYTGVHRDTFTTEIGVEQRTENVTINSEATFQKYAKTEIDNVNATITLTTKNVEEIQTDLKENYYTLTQTDQLIQNSATGVTNTFSEAGGNNIFRNTGLWFATSDSNNPYEFWTGKVTKATNNNASNQVALELQQGDLYQEQQVANGNYTISFKYTKLVELATGKVTINNREYDLSESSDTEFQETIQVQNGNIKITFNCDTDNGIEIYDLMVNAGTVKLAYSQNQNETTTDTVNISKGITITSSNTDTTFKANADGIRTLDSSNNTLTEFTDTGMTTKKMTVTDESQLVGLLVQEVNGQTWFTRI